MLQNTIKRCLGVHITLLHWIAVNIAWYMDSKAVFYSCRIVSFFCNRRFENYRSEKFTNHFFSYFIQNRLISSNLMVFSKSDRTRTEWVMLIYVICTCIESLFAHFCTSVHVLGVNLVHFLARKLELACYGDRWKSGMSGDFISVR